MSEYYFKDDYFVIENYNRKKIFANFLPGVAGELGIPLWVFYLNKAQCISGYGIENKDRPIMEFNSYNKAIETVGQIGYRTFLKVNGKYYEPFNIENTTDHKMYVGKSDFKIEDVNEELGIKTRVTYFGLPNENLGGLVRKVEIENLDNVEKNIEILDGITEILPAGVTHGAFNSISNLIQSWMDVENLKDNFAFMKLRSSTNDSAEVSVVKNGNFYLGHVDSNLITPIVDQETVFGYNTSRSRAINFEMNPLKELLTDEQITVNKIPCSFIPYQKVMKSKELITIYAVSGYTHSVEFLKTQLSKLTNSDYLEDKEIENKEIVNGLLNDVASETAFPIFDEYVKQNYLDNFLRGGYPKRIGNAVYHMYSRRHGDLERDYNYFQLAPEYYSQGTGNFRDVCQNRRMDTFINPLVEEKNIVQFMSLIQLDGHNPLGVNGYTYLLKDESVLKDCFFESNKLISDFFKEKFTPGKLVNFIENNKIDTKLSREKLLELIINNSREYIEADFGEGYWSDHFTYIFDLIESYQGIFPDKLEHVLYDNDDYMFFDSPIHILKKTEKSYLTKERKVRQYDAILHYDKEKIEKNKLNIHGSNFVKLNGREYKTNLYVKLLSLVLNKYSQLDPYGYGVEMESEKPGWNDAMNGLPGLFGSGVSETIETIRIIEFLIKNSDAKRVVKLPKEIYDLLNHLSNVQLTYDERLNIREGYRDEIRFGLKGQFKNVKVDDIRPTLVHILNIMKQGVEKVTALNGGIVPTFLTYEVTKYHEIKDEAGNNIIGNYKLPLVKPLEYKLKMLPNFLEAPARVMKINYGIDRLREMHQKIKSSDIYDENLEIYKTSSCLEKESMEIGRIRAFTKGWLEREANFLHMTYKYLLGLIKAGLYEEFYEELHTNLVCFMDPEVYGRSTLENSSFIAPSNNPNPKIHGQGFFARLSGSTVETLNMWTEMMTGGNPFKLKDSRLIFKIEPKLSKAFFDDNKEVSFTFLKNTKITIVNDQLLDTYKEGEVTKIILINNTDKVIVHNDHVEDQLAKKVRNGQFKEIKVYINKN